jgi:hypothetical protein
MFAGGLPATPSRAPDPLLHKIKHRKPDLPAALALFPDKEVGCARTRHQAAVLCEV